MDIKEIQQRLAAETRIHEAAIAVRKLLDELADVELPEGRNAAEEAIALATNDD